MYNNKRRTIVLLLVPSNHPLLFLVSSGRSQLTWMSETMFVVDDILRVNSQMPTQSRDFTMGKH